MRKIKYHTGNSFDFHKEVVGRKRDEDLKLRIRSLDADMTVCFTNYDNAFKADTLTSLVKYPFNKEQEKDQATLYGFDHKKFRDLFEELTTSNGREDMLCPSCQLEDSESLDHYIPKSDYTEFIDHPKNLIPCCSYCNGHKSANWKDGNKRIYPNVYIDTFPVVQFLFADVFLNDMVIQVKFRIDNTNGIDAVIYERLKHHYEDLELCKRYKMKAAEVITELRREVQGYYKFSGYDPSKKDNIRNHVIQEEKKMQNYYGVNYWKSILRIALCQTDNVFDFLLIYNGDIQTLAQGSQNP